MPLLGRLKSSSGSSQSPPGTSGTNNSNNNPKSQPQATNNRQQQLCESPLFGMRRQLPNVLDGSSSSNYNDDINNLVGQHQHKQKVVGNNNNKQQQESQQSSAGSSSIPQQITRQQIHYAFSIMDSDKDGHVDVRDLSQMLSNLGIPIDEAILSHIMRNTVSKRGDHRISEAEFLDWISHFIEIKSEDSLSSGEKSGSDGGGPQQQQQQHKRNTTRTAVRATRSSNAGSSLVAQPNEMPRARRGSGSGLALMRSLSGSSSSTFSSSTASSSSTTATATTATTTTTTTTATTKLTNEHQKQDRKQQASKKSLQHQSSTDSVEARKDLKAAFCVFDLDGDGYITLDEVRAGLKLLGESWTPTELRQLFSKCSGGGNIGSSDPAKQRISIDDFVRLLL